MSNGRSRSGPRASTNRDRIRCPECREYDHFVRECPTRQEKREIEQIQQMFNLDDKQTPTQTLLMDIDDEEMITPTESGEWFKLVKGRDGPTTFLSISQSLGGNRGTTIRQWDCLTPRQTNFIYKKVELGSLINKNTMKEELDVDRELDRMDNNNGDENPYRDLVVNNADRIELLHSPNKQ